MSKTKVIKISNLPTKLPIIFTATVYLLLDKFNPPGWVWGTVGVAILLLWVICIGTMVNDKYVDIFDYIQIQQMHKTKG